MFLRACSRTVEVFDGVLQGRAPSNTSKILPMVTPHVSGASEFFDCLRGACLHAVSHARLEEFAYQDETLYVTSPCTEVLPSLDGEEKTKMSTTIFGLSAFLSWISSRKLGLPTIKSWSNHRMFAKRDPSAQVPSRQRVM